MVRGYYHPSGLAVEVLDHMGTDLTVVNAARVSFNQSTDVLTDKDIKLLNYLAKHRHFTPFTHCTITLRETMPLFIARQRFKHSKHWSYNEPSGRYIRQHKFYMPTNIREAPVGSVKQGSGASNDKLTQTYVSQIQANAEQAMALYDDMIKDGVCKEQARMVLPANLMVSYVTTGSLQALIDTTKLRIAKDAQLEIQWFAHQWLKILFELYPLSADAYSYLFTDMYINDEEYVTTNI